MHECKVCNIKCKCEYDFKRHLNTKKHKSNIDKDNYCRGCYKTLSNKFNRERHEKSCNVYQTNNNQTTNQTLNQNSNINTINGDNNVQTNIENMNIILNGVKNAESFVITIEDLIKKNLTTALQKVILEDMLESDTDIMDFIGKFDELVQKEHDEFMHEHNHYCEVTKKVKKTNEDGEEIVEYEDWTPLTHPEYRWRCSHAEGNFKLPSWKLSNVLINTFLEGNHRPVLAHLNRLGSTYVTDVLYKHLKTLHSDQILLEFLRQSTKKDLFQLDENYRPSLEIKKKYPQYYEKLEIQALKLKENYNNVVRRKRRQTPMFI